MANTVKTSHAPTRSIDWRIAAVGLVLVAGLFAPVAASAVSLIGTAALSKRRAVVGFTTVAVVALVLAWVNVGKEVVNDWSWYVQHYQVLAYTPLNEYIGQPVGPVSSKPSEPLYYLFASFLSVTTGANVAVLAVAITLIIYSLMGAAIVMSVVSEPGKPSTLIVATVAGLLIGLTFTLSIQLVRQEIAAALIGLAIVTSAKRRWITTAVLLTSAALTHNSALIPAAGLLLAIVFRGRSKGRAAKVALSGIIFYGLGRAYLAIAGEEGYAGQDNGSISTAVVAMDAAILIVFLYLVLKRGLGENPIAATVLLCLPAFYGFVLGVASQPIPLLRMYFFVEVLRALMVAFICIFLMRGRMRLLVGVLIVAAAFAYFALRLLQSPFVYENSVLDILLWSSLRSGSG